MRFRSFTIALASALGLFGLSGGCSQWSWSSLYGEECDGELIAQGEECRISLCGDGLVSEGEQCDDANLDDADGCLSSCVLAVCGDGIVWKALEDCDDGNLEAGDGCSERCRQESLCGDGKISGMESCDDGGNEPGDGCSPDCLIESDPIDCGNGSLDGAEVCDDGNSSNDDHCLSGCTWSTCGDGVTRQGVELCEDGNSDNGDGCTRSCIPCGQEGSHHWLGTDHCYSYHGEWVSYGEAFSACVEAGGYLWTATSSAEAGEIERNLVPDNQEVWLGLGNTKGNRSWITGESSDYRPWIAGQPQQACSLQFGSGTSDENFLTRRCSTARPYVCEFEPAQIEPVTHIAYRRYFSSVSFADAGALCLLEGATLVTLETTAERDFVFRVYGNDYWVGATQGSSGELEWLSGVALSDALLKDADTSGTGACLHHAAGELVVGPCEQARAFVCEFK